MMSGDCKQQVDGGGGGGGCFRGILFLFLIIIIIITTNMNDIPWTRFSQGVAPFSRTLGGSAVLTQDRLSPVSGKCVALCGLRSLQKHFKTTLKPTFWFKSGFRGGGAVGWGCFFFFFVFSSPYLPPV